MSHVIEVSRETSDHRVYEVSPEAVVYAPLDARGRRNGYGVRTTWAADDMPRDVERLAAGILSDHGYTRLRAAISGYHGGQYSNPVVWGWRHEGTGRCWVWLEWVANGKTLIAAEGGEYADIAAAEKFCEQAGVRFDAQGIY